MDIVAFKGFGGVRLEAEVSGDEHDPAILVIHGPGRTRAAWNEIASMMVQAGRRVINLDMRGHGGSAAPGDGRFDLDALAEDLRAVLAQLGSRPVVLAAPLAGLIAVNALAQDAANLAAGLVLVDLPRRDERTPDWYGQTKNALTADELEARLVAAAPGLSLPILLVRGGLSGLKRHVAMSRFEAGLPNAEVAEVAEAELSVVTDRTEAFVGLLLDFLDRKQPRAATEFRMGSDARTLRDAMGCFATGITIVTATGPDGNPIGLTANSFTSLSLDPPLLLVCIANTAGSAPVLREVEHFGINLLQIGQQPTSNRFAGKVEDRFAATPWTPGEHGVPLLDGALGSFECRNHAVHDGGDHFILVGEVLRAQFDPRRDPLLYFRGKYRRLHFA